MKFLVFSDLHSNASVVPLIHDAIVRENCEFAVCLGDVTDFGTVEEARSLLSQIGTTVYVIPGNCDPLDLPDGITEPAIDMHGKSTEVNGYRLVGLGGSNITIFHTPFELEEEDITDGLEGISEEGMILMTHAPSFGILDHIPSGQSVGSPAIKDIVDRFRPILAMSGHIHEDFGVVTENGTVFLNPGPAKEGRMAIVEINGKDVKTKLI